SSAFPSSTCMITSMSKMRELNGVNTNTIVFNSTRSSEDSNQSSVGKYVVFVTVINHANSESSDVSNSERDGHTRPIELNVSTIIVVSSNNEKGLIVSHI